MIFIAENMSIDNLIEYVATKEPRREDDIVQVCRLTEPEKAAIIASNYSWLTLAFGNYHLTLDIAKALGRNKNLTTIIFQYGCSFDDGVFKELARIPTLKKLLLPESKITDTQVLEILECKKWEVLDFYSCNLTDKILKPILAETTWKVIHLGSNRFCSENYTIIKELDELCRSYMFDESLTYEQKEKMIRSIYTDGGELHHRYSVPV